MFLLWIAIFKGMIKSGLRLFSPIRFQALFLRQHIDSAEESYTAHSSEPAGQGGLDENTRYSGITGKCNCISIDQHDRLSGTTSIVYGNL